MTKYHLPGSMVFGIDAAPTPLIYDAFRCQVYSCHNDALVSAEVYLGELRSCPLRKRRIGARTHSNSIGSGCSCEDLCYAPCRRDGLLR